MHVVAHQATIVKATYDPIPSGTLSSILGPKETGLGAKWPEVQLEKEGAQGEKAQICFTLTTCPLPAWNPRFDALGLKKIVRLGIVPCLWLSGENGLDYRLSSGIRWSFEKAWI